MNQQSLFEEALSTPIARASDPRTSHLSAREVTESGTRERQLDRCLELVKRYPLSTSAELAKFGKIDRYIAGRRLPELMEGKLVMQRAARYCTVSGRKAVTWEAL